MADKQSIYEKALLDIKVIQEALKANTKEILRSVGKEEIDGLVQESLQESDYEEEDVDTADDDTETTDTDAPESDDSAADDSAADSDEDGAESGEEISVDSDETDVQIPDEVGADDQDSSMGADALGGDELDMTASSDDDVIAIYKKLSGDDEIEIVGDEIHMNISEPGEYIITKGGLGGDGGAAIEEPIDAEVSGDALGADEFGGEEVETDAVGGDDFSADALGGEEDETDDFEDGLTYEIAMDDEEPINETTDIESVSAETVTEEEEDENLEEAEAEEDETIEEKISIGTGMSVGTHRADGPKSIGAPENPKSKTNESVSAKKLVSEAEVKYSKLLTEATKLKAENDEFRDALKKFRSMLIETVVYNSNLSYVAKLFMEHSTTKEEKKKIIQRFDAEVTDLPQSKRLYKSIVSELEARKPLAESVVNKITKEVTSSSSKQLNEATAYVDPSTQRIKDLINRVENR